MKQQQQTIDSNNSSSSSWQELMGSDLLLKTLHHRGGGAYETSSIANDNSTTTTTTTTVENPIASEETDNDNDTNDINSVQLHDIVRIDFIGYYCNDTTKQQLFSLLPYHNTDKNDNHNNNHNNDTTTTTTDTNDNDINNKLQLLFNTLPIFHIETNLLCCIGDKDVIPALEMGLRFMFLYNTSIIYSHSKYAYGISTRAYQYNDTNTNTNNNTNNNTNTFTLPSQSNVIYQVTIHEIIHSTNTTKYNDPVLQIQLCQSKKHLANDIYKNDIIEPSSNKNDTNDSNNDHHQDNSSISNYNNNNNNNTYNKHRAIHIYQRIIERLDNLIIELQQQQEELEEELNNNESNNNNNHENDNTTIQRTKDIIKQAKQIQIDCYNNISAVYMKCHLYHFAKETCLQHIIANRDPHNIKALYRIAKASIYDPSSSYHEVQATIQALQEELNYMIQQQQKEQQKEQLIVSSDDTNDDTNNNNNTNHNIVAIHQLQNDIQKLKKEYKVHVTKYKQQQHIISTNIAKKLLNTSDNNTKTKEQSPTTQSIDVSSERDENSMNNNDVVSKNKNQRKMYLYTIIISIFVFVGLLYTIMYYSIRLHSLHSSTTTNTTIQTNKVVSNEL